MPSLTDLRRQFPQLEQTQRSAPLAIRAYTLTHALGAGRAATLTGLRQQQSGLRPCDFPLADLPTWILDYENAVNNAAITIRGLSIPQYTGKLSNIRVGDLKIEGDYQYFEFSYTLEVRRDKWIPLKILDQGLRYKSGADRKHIMDQSTPPRPVSSPKLLDGSGGVLSDPTPNNAVYKEFTVYYARNFSILPGVT